MNLEIKTSSSFWSWTGKLATLAGLVWVIIQIFRSVLGKEYDISAYGEHSILSYPSSFSSQLEKLNTRVLSDSLASRVPKLKDRWDRFEISETFRSYLDTCYPSELRDDLRRLKSVWHIRVRNDGSREVSDMKLELPFDGAFELERSSDPNVAGRFKKVIAIGSLRPSNEISVTIWAEGGTLIYDEDETRITHPSGVIAIDYPETVTGFLAWYKRTVGFNLWMNIFLFLMLSSLLFGVYQVLTPWLTMKKSDSKNASNPQTDNQQNGS